MKAPFPLPPLLEHAPVPIAALDLEGHVIGVNRRLLDVSGYDIDELRGRSFSSFLKVGNEAAARAAFTRLVSGAGGSYQASQRYRTRSGDLRDVELSLSVVPDDTGAPHLCLAVLHDVTEHKRARDEAARHGAQLEAVIESIPAAVYIGDATGITLTNRAGLEQLGFETRDQLKQPIPELSDQLQNRDAATGERLQAGDEPFARALGGHEVDAEVISRHLRTGDLVIQRVIAAPVRVGGQIVGAVAINANITDRRRTEEALRLSEARYRALVEQSPLSIQILDPDGHTLQVNSAWERLWGARLEQIHGYNILEDRQLEQSGVMPYIRRAFDGIAGLIPPTLYDPDETIPDVSSRDDPRRWVRAVIYPIKDDRDRVREVVLIHEDITEQVWADEQRRAATELLQLVIQQSGEAIVVADETGVVRIFNPAAERLHGVPAEPTPPEQWSKYYRLLGEDGAPLPLEQAPLYRALHGETVRDARWLVARDDGSTRMLVGTAAPLRTPDGKPAGAVLIARDDTDRAATERERERLLEQAQRAQRELESAIRLKDEFLATLSHELRTPLNAVMGWTRILRERQSDPETVQALDVIERNAVAQARLIDDLLDMSGIIAGKIGLHIEPVDLSKPAAAALETVRLAAEARGVRLDAEIATDLPELAGDEQRLQQVFWNLLSNAVKFTDAGGRVTLSVARDGGAIRATVADTGIGISPEILPFVFDRFTQADASSTRAHAGLGLGLAIVRHLVELHGGTVSAESPGPGQGATFRVWLPVSAPTVRSAAFHGEVR